MSVDVELDDGFVLTTDGETWVTAKRAESEDGEKARLRARKYHTSLISALRRLSERRLAASEASSMEELLSVHRRHLGEIEKLVARASVDRRNGHEA